MGSWPLIPPEDDVRSCFGRISNNNGDRTRRWQVKVEWKDQKAKENLVTMMIFTKLWNCSSLYQVSQINDFILTW